MRYAVPRAAPSSLKSQILRAADSVVSNVVEGCAASSNKEFARFLAMSIRSNTELEGHLRKARDLGFLVACTHGVLADDTIEVRKMTVVLRRRVLERGD